MKFNCFLMIFLFKVSTNLFSQNNHINYTVTDSTILFNKVDSLKKDEHTEFALSTFLVNYQSQEELRILVDKLANNFLPEGYVICWGNKTYYPKTEYINDETDKKFNQTFAYIKENSFETIIYLLKPSRSITR